MVSTLVGNRAAKRVSVAVLAIASVILPTGCSAVEEGPSVIATPDITWASQSTSPLESDRYVEAARVADLGYTVAFNAADFSIEQFTSTHTGDGVASTARGFLATFVKAGRSPEVYPGPAIRLPLEVVENAAGDGAVITVCEAMDNWVLSAGVPETRPELTGGRILTVQIGTSEQTGELVEIDTTSSSDDCDATGAAVGLFVPEPDIPEIITEDDVRMPLGSQD